MHATRFSAFDSLNVMIHRCRLVNTQKSFLYNTSVLWNNLPLAVKQQDNLAKFKYAVKAHMKYKINMFIPSNLNKPLPNKLARGLLQIRLGLSCLNGHLFKYNIVDNPFCPNCYDHVESTIHYFLECPVYSVQRVMLLHNVSVLYNTLTNFPLLGVSDWNDLPLIEVVSLLTAGFSPFATDLILNLRILDDLTELDNSLYVHVIEYMYLSKRFVN